MTDLLKQHAKWLEDSETGKRADLVGADLRGADLGLANLRRANLGGADFRGADLWRADLRGADLREADFRGADLVGADLRRADLRGANLVGANLWEADLRFVLTAKWLAFEAQPGVVQIGCRIKTREEWLESADELQKAHGATDSERAILEAFIRTCGDD